MEQNISRICHKIYFPNDTSEVSPCPTPWRAWLPRLLACSTQRSPSARWLPTESRKKQTDTVFQG